MRELRHPHDRFFRAVFGRREFVQDLIADALPDRVLSQLDLGSVEVAGESFVDEKLAAHQADLLVRTRLRGSPLLLYILVEHKSSPDRWTTLQLLRYMLRIWERERSTNPRARTLPVIVPIVFYHGRSKWRFPLEFSGYFAANDDLSPFVPGFAPIMFDLQNLDVARLRGGFLYRTAVKTLKYAAFGLRAHLGELLRGLQNAPQKAPMDETYEAFLITWFEYIIQAGKDVAPEDVAAELDRSGSEQTREVYMTIAEQLLARGKAEGKAEGKREGELQSKRGVLLRQLEKKFGHLPEPARSRIMGLSDPASLDRALDLVLEARSPEQVLAALE